MTKSWSAVRVGAWRAMLLVCVPLACGGQVPAAPVEGQPLAGNIARLVEALEYLGAPLPADLREALAAAGRDRDAGRLQELLDPHVLLVVSINPERRVKVERGRAEAVLQQGGYTPVIVKVLNTGAAGASLRIASPQGGAVYAGGLDFSLARQGQVELNRDQNVYNDPGRFLAVEMFDDPPMTDRLSGLSVEYAIALIYSTEAGPREATIGFDIGQGTQDLGFRGETPVLFDVRPAVPVRITVRDERGEASTAKLVIRDAHGRVHPPQPKRLAPDLFFQPQVYRADGESVHLPPGRFTVLGSRGPEYRVVEQELVVPDRGSAELIVNLRRWVAPARYGFYSGDHHIHAAGCAHYSVPTLGVHPEHVLRQVKGEGLNVGGVLTWSFGWEYQNRFFTPAPAAHPVSEPFTAIKYDVEVAGFGSQLLGHVCLLNLKSLQYPGSQGTDRGWPTWTLPVLRWAREQGAVTGYPHSAMPVDVKTAAQQALVELDKDKSGGVTLAEASDALLPEPVAVIDFTGDGLLTLDELERSHDRAADRLPNLAAPSPDSGGALEVFVSAPAGLCDFLSAMNTARVPEWNTWYHLLNCGLRIKLSGETDYPCMSSRRVGQGRSYVWLGEVDRVDYARWIEGLRLGRSYVSDGYAHALRLSVNGQPPGFSDVSLDSAGQVVVEATVAFAEEQPLDVAHGGITPAAGLRQVGDTVVLHHPRTEQTVRGGERLVEVVVNGSPVASVKVPADGRPHELSFHIPVERSGWVALRQFPQMHTNPVNVLVAGRPIRASRDSARWCAAAVERLWRARHRHIAEPERAEARKAYDAATEYYRAVAADAAPGTSTGM